MFDLRYICSEYELLELLAQNLSTMDLFHTALACSDLNDLIMKPQKKFERLKRVALCDGSGVKARKAFEGVRSSYDPQEVEVKVWNIKCDEKGGLPCLKCGVNVCEECREYPRVGDSYGPCRRPHFTVTYEMYNIIGYCESCDETVESRVGEELCECDRYARWICRACHTREKHEAWWYYKNRTEFYGGWGEEVANSGMTLGDHQHHRMYWCPCGVRTPAIGNIRCSWCKKKHRTKVFPEDDYDPERRVLDFDDQESFSHPFKNDG